MMKKEDKILKKEDDILSEIESQPSLSRTNSVKISEQVQQMVDEENKPPV